MNYHAKHSTETATQNCITIVRTRLHVITLHVLAVQAPSDVYSQKYTKESKMIPTEASPIQISLCNV